MSHTISTKHGVIEVTTKETADGVPIFMVPSHIIQDPEAVKQVKEYFNVN
jgi:hypothetical protein